MKLLFFLALLPSLCCCEKATAQHQPDKICGIYFDYDAVGNRVKRSYDCRSLSTENPNDPPAESSGTGGNDSVHLGGMARKAPPKADAGATLPQMQQLVVFPNPTTGPFTIQLPAQPQAPVHYHWYDAQYRILTSGTLTTQTFKGDISTWADGTYLLQIYWQDRIYGTKIIKVSGSW